MNEAHPSRLVPFNLRAGGLGCGKIDAERVAILAVDIPNRERPLGRVSFKPRHLIPNGGVFQWTLLRAVLGETEANMWALFLGDKRVSRLFVSERACIRAARDNGYFLGPVLIDDYRIAPVR